jgi:hypothetical protein
MSEWQQAKAESTWTFVTWLREVHLERELRTRQAEEALEWEEGIS